MRKSKRKWYNKILTAMFALDININETYVNGLDGHDDRYTEYVFLLIICHRYVVPR